MHGKEGDGRRAGNGIFIGEKDGKEKHAHVLEKWREQDRQKSNSEEGEIVVEGSS